MKKIKPSALKARLAAIRATRDFLGHLFTRLGTCDDELTHVCEHVQDDGTSALVQPPPNSTYPLCTICDFYVDVPPGGILYPPYDP